MTAPHLALARPWKAKRQLAGFCLDALDAARAGAVRFVQVGANDGRLDDPIAPYLDKGGWTGLRIEPHPAYFADLSALHAGDRAVRVVNCAVSDTPGEMDLHHLAEAARPHYPAWARGCASLKPNRLAEVLDGKRQPGGAVAPGDIAAVGVPVRRLDDILAEAGIGAVDLLVIDVEGFEAQVLDSVDLAGLNLLACMVECNGSDLPAEGAIAARLAAAGLVTFRLRDDLVALHPERLTVPVGEVLRLVGQVPVGADIPVTDPAPC